MVYARKTNPTIRSCRQDGRFALTLLTAESRSANIGQYSALLHTFKRRTDSTPLTSYWCFLDMLAALSFMNPMLYHMTMSTSYSSCLLGGGEALTKVYLRIKLVAIVT